MRHFKLYLALVPIFFAVDMLWLGVVAVDFYMRVSCSRLSRGVTDATI